MRTFQLTAAIFIFCGCSSDAGPQAQPQGTPPLRQVQTIDLPNVEGRFDHFAVDLKHNRLYLAALGNNSLEVIDTAAGKDIQSIKGLRKPQGVAFIPDTNQIAVANGDDGTLRFYDASTLQPSAKIDQLDDADNVRYDAKSRRLYVGYGDGALAVIDTAATPPRKLADIKLDAHPESFQLEHDGPRIFVNLPEAKHVAVIDRDKSAVIAKWPLTEAKSNFPMALDEPNHRLFVGCRNPAKLLVLDSTTGKPVASLPCAGDTDDLFYDPATHHIYLTGGEGAISTFAQSTPDAYTPAGTLPTAPGARTSFFIADTATLYVAVPHRGAQNAELRVFRTPQ
jgi:YVTN family beta-propeller protein